MKASRLIGTALNKFTFIDRYASCLYVVFINGWLSTCFPEIWEWKLQKLHLPQSLDFGDNHCSAFTLLTKHLIRLYNSRNFLSWWNYKLARRLHCHSRVNDACFRGSGSNFNSLTCIERYSCMSVWQSWQPTPERFTALSDFPNSTEWLPGLRCSVIWQGGIIIIYQVVFLMLVKVDPLSVFVRVSLL